MVKSFHFQKHTFDSTLPGTLHTHKTCRTLSWGAYNNYKNGIFLCYLLSCNVFVSFFIWVSVANSYIIATSYPYVVCYVSVHSKLVDLELAT